MTSTKSELHRLLADYVLLERWEREIADNNTFRADSRKFAAERADRYRAIVNQLRTEIAA